MDSSGIYGKAPMGETPPKQHFPYRLGFSVGTNTYKIKPHKRIFHASGARGLYERVTLHDDDKNCSGGATSKMHIYQSYRLERAMPPMDNIPSVIQK